VSKLLKLSCREPHDFASKLLIEDNRCLGASCKEWPDTFLEEDRGFFAVFVWITSRLERVGPADKEEAALSLLLGAFLRTPSRLEEGNPED
jgi:hypothetical protein